MEDRYLYKAKRADNGEWVQGYLFDDGFENGRVFIGGLVIEKYTGTACDDWTISGSCFCEVDKSTICQCTGLKDKNGKLIWENDILDGFTYPYMSDGVHNYYVEVCWCTNVPSFCIYTQKYPEAKVAGISAGNTELMEGWNPDDWEVIGNIFDNPELLESEE